MPDALTEKDYCGMVAAALRKLFVITGRAALYDETRLQRRDGVAIQYDGTLPVDEQEYVLLTAEIMFFRKVQTDVNNTFGYTTDALAVTNADKPYANLSLTIRELENQ